MDCGAHRPICDHITLPFFFFNDTATTEIYTLSLHDALPTSSRASSIAQARPAGPAPTISTSSSMRSPAPGEPSWRISRSSGNGGLELAGGTPAGGGGWVVGGWSPLGVPYFFPGSPPPF